VVAREPVAASETFPAEVGELYFFTQVVGASGRAEVLHVWIYDGREVAIVPLAVEGSRWRTWSKKRILPHFIGDWTVEVRGVGGEVLLSATCRVE
jgi:hypothetical protein